MNQDNAQRIRKFWDKKILGWEADRYERQDLVAKPLQLRMKYARDWLSMLPENSRVVELGAGSCRLLENIVKNKPQRTYLGVDVSQAAIEKAKERARQANLPNAKFIVCSIQELHPPACDAVFSLGLLDWLSPAELKKIAQLSHGKIFLHSFSERHPFSVLQIVHRLYTFLYYGWRNGNYRPRYHSRDEIQKLFGDVEFAQLEGMGFAMFARSRS